MFTEAESWKPWKGLVEQWVGKLGLKRSAQDGWRIEADKREMKATSKFRKRISRTDDSYLQ